MSDRKSVRLIDLTILVPSDVTKGFIKCKSGREIEFTDVSHLTKQYQLDTVEGFDSEPLGYKYPSFLFRPLLLG